MVSLINNMQMERKKTVQKQNSEFIDYYDTLLKEDKTLKEHFPQEMMKCRVCLQVGRFSIMDSTNGAVRDMLVAVTSVKVDKNDELPKRLCSVCYKFLKVAIQFRAVAKRTEEEFMCYMAVKPEPPDDTEGSEYNVNIVKLEPLENDDEIIDSKNEIVTYNLPKISCESVNYNTGNVYESMENLEDMCDYCVKNIRHVCPKTCVEMKGKGGVIKRMTPNKKPTENTTQSKNNCVSMFNKVEKDFSKIFDIPDYEYIGKRLRRPEVVTCKICDLSMKYRSMRQHYTLKHNPNAHTFMCEFCGQTYITKQRLELHITTHFNNFPFECALCSYKGKTQYSLTTHMRKHKTTYTYWCDYCPSKFNYKSNIIRHVRGHQEPTHKCDKCSKAFQTKPILQQHIESVHFGIRKFKCLTCGNFYSSKKKLRHHERNIHKMRIIPSKPFYLTEAQDNNSPRV